MRNTLSLFDNVLIALLRNFTVGSLCLLFTSALVPAVEAQEDESMRVLVLHGSWGAANWTDAFDDALQDLVEASAQPQWDVLYQYLGLNVLQDPAALDAMRNYIISMAESGSVDLIAAALPQAVEFLISLDLPADLPKVAIVPSLDQYAALEAMPNTLYIRSPARETIRRTVQQMQVLLPNLDTVHVVASSGESAAPYVEITRGMEGEFDGLTFNYLVGTEPSELIEHVSTLDTTDGVFYISNNVFLDDSGVSQSMPDSNPEDLSAVSGAPLFSIYDVIVGQGITGGNVSSVSYFAETFFNLGRENFRSGIWPQVELIAPSRSIYDWREVQRWNLQIDRLNEPVQYLFEPLSLRESNPTLYYSLFTAFGLLAVIVALMVFFNRRLRGMNLQLKASEIQARDSQALYQLLAENTVDVIWTYDPKANRSTYCSPSITRLTGFTPEEFVSKSPAELLTPESIQRVQELYAHNNPAERVIEIESYTKTGGTVSCELSAHPVNTGSKDELWVGVSRDISKRKQFEEIQKSMETAIRQNQKFETLGTLASGIAHDFNNILGVTTGVVDLLRELLKDNEAGLKLVDRLKTSHKKAADLVQQILTFSRQKDVDKEVVELEALLEGCMTILESGIPRTVEFNTSFDCSMRILANSTQIEQIVLNLVTNAMEALSGHSGAISLALTHRHFPVETILSHGIVGPGEYACISVKDNGRGMSQRTLERAFDPFFSTKELGNGMGLSILQSIVLQHQGAVDVETAQGIGTTFRVYLPVTQLQPEEKDLMEIPNKIPDPLRILVIDDQEELLEVIAMMLEALDHEVVCCKEPRDALTIIEKEADQLSLVITDYSMPVVDGLQIVNYCHEHYPALPIIVSTGYGDTLPKYSSGGAPLIVLAKPYEMSKLEHTIQSVLNAGIPSSLVS